MRTIIIEKFVVPVAVGIGAMVLLDFVRPQRPPAVSVACPAVAPTVVLGVPAPETACGAEETGTWIDRADPFGLLRD